MTNIDAIAAADLHLCHTPPIARSAETDWYGVMQARLNELGDLHYKIQEKEGIEIPIVYGGDVLDKWIALPELLSFAIKFLPRGYAVAGQHDLPHHSLKDIKRSAFWTLVEAKVLTPLMPDQPVSVGRVRLHGFPFGVPLKPCHKPHSIAREIAVVHAYCWSQKFKTGYPDAPLEQAVRAYAKNLPGYDFAVFGDNHQCFTSQPTAGCTLINCGGFFRRRIDEKKHRPSVWLIGDNKEVERHELDCSQDVFLADEVTANSTADEMDIYCFVRDMEAMADSSLDFRASVMAWIDKYHPSPGVKAKIFQALERGQAT